MFCFQCQEAAANQGCTVKGVCGKDALTADLQDLLIFFLKGMSYWAYLAKQHNLEVREEAKLFVAEGLFTTITNVNFDPSSLSALIEKAQKIRNELREKVLSTFQPEAVPLAARLDLKQEEFAAQAAQASFLKEENADIRSLKSLILFGLKGIAAYLDHAYILKFKQEAISDFIYRGALPNSAF